MLFTHRVRVRDPFKIHAIYLLVDVYSIPSGKRLHITMENHPLHSWVSINIEHVGIYIKLIVNIAIRLWSPRDPLPQPVAQPAIGGFSPSYDNFKIQCCGPSSMKNTPGFV